MLVSFYIDTEQMHNMSLRKWLNLSQSVYLHVSLVAGGLGKNLPGDTEACPPQPNKSYVRSTRGHKASFLLPPPPLLTWAQRCARSPPECLHGTCEHIRLCEDATTLAPALWLWGLSIIFLTLLYLCLFILCVHLCTLCMWKQFPSASASECNIVYLSLPGVSLCV